MSPVVRSGWLFRPGFPPHTAPNHAKLIAAAGAEPPITGVRSVFSEGIRALRQRRESGPGVDHARRLLPGIGPSGLASSSFFGTPLTTIPTITRRRLRRVLRVLRQAGFELRNPRHQLRDPCCLSFDHRRLLLTQLDQHRFQLGHHPLLTSDYRLQLATPGLPRHPNIMPLTARNKGGPCARSARTPRPRPAE